MSNEQKPEPKPDNGLEQWCAEFCPTLPVRIESVISEWDIRSAKDAQLVRNIILEHVRQSVSTV